MAQPLTFRWNGQYADESSARTNKYIDWDALLREVQALSSRSCSYDGEHHVGGRHIVRRFIFADTGERWLVRIPVVPGSDEPLSKDDVSSFWTAKQKFKWESEIATMKYLSERMTTPVPAIHGYSTSIDGNPVKVPYMLMQCIEGNILYDLESGGTDALDEEQKRKVRKAVASIQCQLANASISKAGSLILGPDGEVEIGPLPSWFGSKGPFTSEIDYFRSWAAHIKYAEFCSANAKFLIDNPEDTEYLRDVKQGTREFASKLTPIVENAVVKVPFAREGCFPILHRDLGMHNILFDDAFNVVGVIDWEYAHSAPLEVFSTVTNVPYCKFDHEGLHSVPHAEYVKDIMDSDKGLGQNCGLLDTYNSFWGDLGQCMYYFEEGKAIVYGSLSARLDEVKVDEVKAAEVKVDEVK
ncbi:hypothetical protein FQN57_002759 [Myotisia sp. PD_48]|nr:hypothetical protein FQN57_002759 [Myotisia sp. PD_48]